MDATPALQAFLLVTALSIDAFAASFAYGSKKIKIPASSIIVINLICSAILALALLLEPPLRIWCRFMLRKRFRLRFCFF